MRFEPMPEGGFEFINEVVGGSVPREFIKPTEQGIKEALERGILAGYRSRRPRDPVRRLVPRRRLVGNGVQDRRFDGLPGRREESGPILLEPIMDVEVVTRKTTPAT